MSATFTYTLQTLLGKQEKRETISTSHPHIVIVPDKPSSEKLWHEVQQALSGLALSSTVCEWKMKEDVLFAGQGRTKRRVPLALCADALGVAIDELGVDSFVLVGEGNGGGKVVQFYLSALARGEDHPCPARVILLNAVVWGNAQYARGLLQMCWLRLLAMSPFLLSVITQVRGRSPLANGVRSPQYALPMLILSSERESSAVHHQASLLAVIYGVAVERAESPLSQSLVRRIAAFSTSDLTALSR